MIFFHIDQVLSSLYGQHWWKVSIGLIHFIRVAVPYTQTMHWKSSGDVKAAEVYSREKTSDKREMCLYIFITRETIFRKIYLWNI